MKEPKSLNIGEIVQRILDEQGITPYGAARIVGAETDENLSTVEDRIYRLLKNEPPKTWNDILWLLHALGYEVEIKAINKRR